MFTKNHRASWEGFALCFFCSPVSSSECKSLLTGLPVSGSSTAFCRPAPGCQCWANITPRLERSRAVDDINWSQPISIEIRWQDFAQSFTGEDLSDHFTPLQGAKTLVVVGSPSMTICQRAVAEWNDSKYPWKTQSITSCTPPFYTGYVNAFVYSCHALVAIYSDCCSWGHGWHLHWSQGGL